MTGFASGGAVLFAPIKQSTLGIVAAIVGFVTWTFSSGSLPSWLPPTWSDANAMSRDSILLVGPVVAGAAAWIGGWRHTLAIGPAPARGWHNIMFAQLSPLAAAVVFGHLVGLIPAIVDTATNSTGGSMNPLAIISGVVAILAVTCLGYLLGAIWSSRIAPVVAAVAVFPGIVGPILIGDAFTSSATTGTSGASMYGIALSWMDLTVGIGRQETVGGAVVRIALFAALGGAAMMVAIRSAGRDDRNPRWGAALPMAAPAALCLAILFLQPSLVEASTEALICEPVPDSTICVEPEVRNVLPSLAAGAANTVERFGYGAGTGDIHSGTPLSDLVSFPLYSDSPEQATSEAAITTSRFISGEFACLTRSGMLAGDDSLNSGGELESAYAFAGELSYAIASRSGANQADVDAYLTSFESDDATALAALSDAELRAFLDQHATELANCARVRP